MRTVTLAACMLFASRACGSPSLRIHHRIWDPAADPPPFSPRANLQVSSELESVRLVPEDPLELVLRPGQPENALYQVALQRADDLSENDWDVSSVKACHLPQAQADIMVIHLTSPERTPYAIDFFLHPIPHNGSCPKESAVQTSITFTNTTLKFQLASPPPIPELRVPLPLSPAGEPIQPEPEKSFLQKYWMYLAIGLLTLMLTGGTPEEDTQSHADGPRTGGR